MFGNFFANYSFFRENSLVNSLKNNSQYGFIKKN